MDASWACRSTGGRGLRDGEVRSARPCVSRTERPVPGAGVSTGVCLLGLTTFRMPPICWAERAPYTKVDLGFGQEHSVIPTLTPTFWFERSGGTSWPEGHPWPRSGSQWGSQWGHALTRKRLVLTPGEHKGSRSCPGSESSPWSCAHGASRPVASGFHFGCDLSSQRETLPGSKN